MTRTRQWAIITMLMVLLIFGCASANQFTISNVQVNSGGTVTADIIIDEIPAGAEDWQGWQLTSSISDPAVAQVSAVSYPSGMYTFTDTTTLPFTSGHFGGIDLTDPPGNLANGSTNLVLATVTFTGLSAGTTTMTTTISTLDGRMGGDLRPDYTVTSPTITVYDIPEAEFAADTVNPIIGDTITFTDQSTGNPTSWAWDFGDGSTSTDQNPTHAYASSGTYTVSLTVTNAAGTDTETKTDYITAGASPADLRVTSISPNVGMGAALFANEPNVISVTIINDGGDAGASTVSVVVDSTTYTAAVGALAAGASTTVTVTDTASYTGGSSVSYTATADSAGVIAESDETNNALTTALTVYNNGYKGKRWTGGSDLTTQASFEGKYDVIYSAGDSAYQSASWSTTTDTWTSTDLPVPAGATVVSARLYQPYTYNQMGTDPAFTAEFNGNTLSAVATYQDIKGFGSYSYPYGTYVYDVTSSFNTAGNTLILTPEGSNSYGMYGAYLVVVYSDATTTMKQIWINDEFDMVYSRASYSTNDDEATAYASFTGIDTTGVTDAKAIAILASAGDSGKSKFFFNSNEYTGFWADYLSTPQIGFSIYDVDAALASGSNEARLQSYNPGSNGDNMYAMNTILVVEKAVSADFTPLPGNYRVGTPYTFTSTSTGTITGYSWDFNNDAVIDSTDANPTHTWTTAGTYPVSLTVTGYGTGNTDTETKTDYYVTEDPIISFEPVSQTILPSDTTSYVIQMDSAANGLAGYDMYVTLANGAVADITEVTYDTSWAQMTMSPTVPADSVRIGAIDAGQQIYPGSTGPFTLATITVRGSAAGTSDIIISGLQMDDDYGDGINALLNTGEIIVSSTTAPVAAFSGTPTSGASPLAVAFTDESTSSSGAITDWYWEFGDGTTSTEQNPTHTYQVGIYTVKLTVTAPGGTDTETKTSYIVSGDAAPEADFTATPTAGLYPMTVMFSDASAGNVSTYYWSFGDGTYSALQNPVHTYTYPGTFTVSLTVSGPGGSDTETKTDYIDTSVAVPVADFIANPISGLNPLHVYFTDQSTGNLSGISYAWDFNNDGTVDSTDQNPDYIYTADGLYTVSLTITTDNGADTETKTNYIDVGGNMAVDFTGDPTSGVASRKVPLYVTFTDATSGSPTAWTWDFGNGNTTGSAEQNPITTYWGRPAQYTVTLTASSGSDTGSLTRNGYITVTPYLDYFPIYDSSHTITGYMTNLPSDLNGDYVYEDINGNGRVDYNDVVTFYNAILGTDYWVQDVTLADFENFDYSGNGAIGYNDVVALNDLVIYT